MALLDTFRGLMDGGESDRKHLNSELRRLYIGFIERAERLQTSAQQAPSESTDSDLRRLASDHRRAAELIRAALEARDSSAPRYTAKEQPALGHNHWARIVADLEAFHHGRDDIQAMADTTLERHPELTDLFEALSRTMDDHITRLRGEIARADPLALN